MNFELVNRLRVVRERIARVAQNPTLEPQETLRMLCDDVFEITNILVEAEVGREPVSTGAAPTGKSD